MARTISEIAASPNSRASCRRCRKRIEKGEPRARVVEEIYGILTQSYLHGLCAVDVDVEGVRAVLARSKAAFEGREAIESIVRTRIDAIAQAERDWAGAVRAVAPAKDREGRPRVRVLLAGSAITLHGGAMLDFEIHSKELSWSSPLREYQFIPQFSGELLPPDDPSQPVVAAVYAPFADSKAMSNQRQKVVGWKARGLPAPLLWIFARGKDLEPTDEQVLRWREFLESAGYNGDEARVLFSRDAKPASLDALVAALDEGAAAVPSDGKLPADVALAHEIEAQCEHERHDAVCNLLSNATVALRYARRSDGRVAMPHWAAGAVRVVTAEGRAALGRAAVRALAFDRCVDDAVAVLSAGAVAEPEPLARAVNAAIARAAADPKRKRNKSVEALIALARSRAIEGRARPWLDALRSARTPARAEMLAELLLLAHEASIEAELVAWIDGLEAKDAIKKALSRSRKTAMRRASKESAESVE